MTDFSRHVRKASRELGVEIHVRSSGMKGRKFLEIEDEHLGAMQSGSFSPSDQCKALKYFHEEVYHARARLKYQMQGGKCAACGRILRGSGECDHITPRSKGRDDTIGNLQIVCPPFSGGCDFHRRKHGH